VSGALTMLDRVASAIEALPAGRPVAISLPSAPLPPLFHPPGWQASPAELQLQLGLMEFAVRLGRSNAKVINPSWIDYNSPPAARYDLKSDLLTGLPYSLAHADALASAIARALVVRPPKKGLITDLDDTLWNGIVGEVGPGNVTWDLESRQQIHGLYQKLLAAL